MPLLGYLIMEKTKFYVPSMYFRKFSGEPFVTVDTFLEIVEDVKGTTPAVEITVHEVDLVDYTERLQEVYDATVEQDVEIPIIRISAPSLFADDKEKVSVFNDINKFLSRFEGLFGQVPVQLETMSAWQVYEMRNETTIHPDKIPVGYKYQVYAEYVIETILGFCSLCKEVGLIPVIEPRVGHVISSPDSVALAEAKYGSLPFQVVFDVTHMEFQGINTCDAWQALKKDTIAVHVSDTDVVNSHHTPIGEGVVPWRTILKYAGESQDVKFIAVELFGDESRDPSVIKKNYENGVNEVKALIKKYNLTSKYE